MIVIFVRNFQLDTDAGRSNMQFSDCEIVLFTIIFPRAMAAVRSLFEYESPPGSPAISLEGIAGVHMHRPSCPEPHTKWDAAAAIVALGAFSDDDDDDDGSDGKTSGSGGTDGAAGTSG